MRRERDGFSEKQWNFIAVFEAIGEPVSLDIAGAVFPLLPTQLLDVLNRAQDLSIIKETGEAVYRLSENLSKPIQNKLSAINTQERVSDLLNRLDQLNLTDHLLPETHLRLIIRSGRKEGSQIEINIARKFLDSSQPGKALLYFEKGLKGLSSQLEKSETSNLFIECTLIFSDVSFALGRAFVTAHTFLEIAGPVAERLGDRRAKALIDLHLGRLFYIGNRRQEAVALMKEAEAAIKDLGDEDIKIRAAEFLALYYYMQGRFTEAMKYFETGFRSFEARKDGYIANPSAPVFYGFCAAYLGQFHKAIGNFDSAWRRAKQQGNSAYASVLRASLGMILLLTQKQREASAHIQAAQAEANKHGHALGQYFSQGYIAYQSFLAGNYQEACCQLKEVYEKGKQANIIYQFSSPWFLEMGLHLNKEGYYVYTEQETKETIIRISKDPSIHLRGVILRIVVQLSEGTKNIPGKEKAYIELLHKNLPVKGVPSGSIVKDKKILLKQSETYLKASGDPVQLAKTRIEMAQLELKSGKRERAKKLAGKARKGLAGFWDAYFPDGLRALLDEQMDRKSADTTHLWDNEQLLMTTTELGPSLTLDDFFQRVVDTMNRFFRAERGGLFWSQDQRLQSLSLKVNRHLNLSDITFEGFSLNMKTIHKSFKSGKPIIFSSKQLDGKLNRYNVYALLCIPLKLNNRVSGVLYFDNSYLDNSFDFLDETLLEKLSVHLNTFIDRVQEIEAVIEDAKISSLDTIDSGTEPEGTYILAESTVMKELLKNAKKVAASDSTVLIQGETGVGKELMAEHIHSLSTRNNRPFVIIDPTTIPENLVESELFGYEKGAFTGADRQKRGRIELANNGTLFIDEIGEMSKSIQAKFLRVLQEKDFVRIGGRRPIHSDFRLMAATNRDLASEVAKGNFREDLFYRVSIVPLLVPPLQKRKDDILLMANHFINRYKKKYKYPYISLSQEDKTALTEYPWPGNVRELINVIERAVILSGGNRIELSLTPQTPVDDSGPFSGTPSMDELQSRYIKFILKKTNGKISGKGGAAEILKMKRSTLYSRMDKLGISR